MQLIDLTSTLSIHSRGQKGAFQVAHFHKLRLVELNSYLKKCVFTNREENIFGFHTPLCLPPIISQKGDLDRNFHSESKLYSV